MQQTMTFNHVIVRRTRTETDKTQTAGRVTPVFVPRYFSVVRVVSRNRLIMTGDVH